MAVTRSMSRKQNYDASAGSSSKTSGLGGWAPWAYLNNDVLLLIMMQLGLIDFLAFSGVCKSWRALAISNRNMFMASRRPMLLSISSKDSKDCYLKDHEGRRFKTVLPNGTGRTLVGLSCGYLIMYERRTKGFWLVNPITRHELHFPVYPFYVGFEPAFIKAILVFSPAMSGWVLVIARRRSTVLSFCLAGEQAHWNHLTFDFDILDLHAFKGYIYAINSESSLCELSLNPIPSFTQRKIKNFVELDRLLPIEFLSSGDNLFLIGRISIYMFVYHELKFEESEWVLTQKKIKEYSVFVSDLKGGGAVKPEEFRADPRYERSVRIIEDWSLGSIWFFPHDCFSVNVLKE